MYIPLGSKRVPNVLALIRVVPFLLPPCRLHFDFVFQGPVSMHPRTDIETHVVGLQRQRPLALAGC